MTGKDDKRASRCPKCGLPCCCSHLHRPTLASQTAMEHERMKRKAKLVEFLCKKFKLTEEDELSAEIAERVWDL